METETLVTPAPTSASPTAPPRSLRRPVLAAAAVAVLLALVAALAVLGDASPIDVPALGPEADAAAPARITSTGPQPSVEGVSGASTITSTGPQPTPDVASPQRLTSTNPFVGAGADPSEAGSGS